MSNRYFGANIKPQAANRLRGSATYLAGPMTDCQDFGVSWRKVITPHLVEMGVVVLDPTDKPIEIGHEDAEARGCLQRMRDAGDLHGVRQFMKPVRRVDLRCVDLSSFIIVRLDGTPTWGTGEEISMATSQQKPVLVWLDGTQNYQTVNPWIPSQVNPEYIFESMEDLLAYLRSINESVKHPDDRRWMLFDFERLYRKVLPQDGVTLSPNQVRIVRAALGDLAQSNMLSPEEEELFNILSRLVK